jgi:glycosyltransferase involved in cell wall biosynthesis
LNWFYKHVDKFCYVGEDSKNHLMRMGIASNRMFFSPYSVDDTLFMKQQEQLNRHECRLQLGIRDDQYVFIFSGKMVPRKMPVFLAETILKVPENYKITLIMLGDGIQKNLVENLLRPVLEDRLIMPGFVNQSQLGKYFMAADAFILPSSYDTWGLVVNEAMNFSLPVIASDTVGCRHDLVVPASTGYVFKSGDISSLKGAMLKLLDNPESAREMGNKARLKISEYSISKSVEGILSAIHSF